MGILKDIKEECSKNKVVIQSSESRDLQAKINQLFYRDKQIDKELQFLRSVMTRGQETTERKGLHASAIIKSDKEFCYRQQVLSLFYKQAQGENVPIGLKRIFSEGDAIHEKLQRLFIRGGYADPLDCDFSRFAVEYDLSYTPDIICTVDGVKMVGEIKSMNTYAFQKQREHISGKHQLYLYMYLTGIHKGFTLCEDKNTQDIKVMVYDFDFKEVQPYVARLERIQLLKNRFIKYHKIVKRDINCKSLTCKMANT